MKNIFLFFVVLVLAFVGVGCASGQTHRVKVTHPWNTWAIATPGASELPPTVPRKVRSHTSVYGSAHYEQGTYRSVGQVVRYRSDGSPVYGWVVSDYNYTNSYRYSTVPVQNTVIYTVPGGTIVDPRKGGAYGGGPAFNTGKQPSPWK